MTSTEPYHVGTFVPTPSWLIKSNFVTFVFAAFVSFVLSLYAISGHIKSDAWSSFLVLVHSCAIYPKRNLTHPTDFLFLYLQTPPNMQAHSNILGALDQRLESIVRSSNSQDPLIKSEPLEIDLSTPRYICGQCAWITTNPTNLASHFTHNHVSFTFTYPMKGCKSIIIPSKSTSITNIL